MLAAIWNPATRTLVPHQTIQYHVVEQTSPGCQTHGFQTKHPPSAAPALIFSYCGNWIPIHAQIPENHVNDTCYCKDNLVQRPVHEHKLSEPNLWRQLLGAGGWYDYRVTEDVD